ncbi:MAG TPA: hypothetical protein VKA32_08470, partial [Gammaproteobacteria bacterium]|nr:hypothetical protein [Gammaproteobacteria bacterium]
FPSGTGALLELEPSAGGHFDFLPHVYAETTLSRRSISYRVSDHFPLWMEFGIQRPERRSSLPGQFDIVPICAIRSLRLPKAPFGGPPCPRRR